MSQFRGHANRQHGVQQSKTDVDLFTIIIDGIRAYSNNVPNSINHNNVNRLKAKQLKLVVKKKKQKVGRVSSVTVSGHCD